MEARILRVASIGKADSAERRWRESPSIHVRAFESVRDGLAVIAAEHYDVVVVRRYGSDNVAQMVIAAVRRACPRSAIILLASEPTIATIHLALIEGAQECLPLTCTSETFVMVAQNCVTRHGIRLQLERQALTDPLTGLPNRLAFNQALAEAIDVASTSSLLLAVALIDIDHFKRVNDTFGHAGGDRVLRHVATNLGVNVRRTDVIARLGGDEFACLCTHLSPNAPLHDMATAVRTAISTALVLTNLRGTQAALRVSVSIGVAAYPSAGITGARLLAAADRAMYKAKIAGGGVNVAGTSRAVAERRLTRELELPKRLGMESIAEVG